MENYKHETENRIESNKSNIYKAFIKFQSECPQLELNKIVTVKTKSGKSYNFKYADLTNIHKIVKPLLVKNKLGFIQTFRNQEIVTILIHESGQTIESNLNISNFLSSSNPQDAGGVITYFKRYALSAILGLSSEEDDDANAASGNDMKEKEASGDQLIYIHNLLNTSSINEKLKEGTESEMENFTFQRASECIEWLKDNQSESVNPSQKEILIKLEKAIK